MKVAHTTKMRRMIQDRLHPDVIDGYLTQCGYGPQEIDEIYTDMNLRRRHLLDCYRMKRNVRFIGVLIVLISCVTVFLPRGGLVSIALFAYGSYMAATGSMLIYTPS